MSRQRSAPLQLPLLDRLSSKTELPNTFESSLRTLKESIRRDLEDLLNSRRMPSTALADYPLADRSVLNFGLEDLASLVPHAATAAQHLQRAVCRCLQDFEPRLRDVVVELADSQLAAREIRLHIAAIMPVYPTAQTVSFDTLLDLASGVYSVD